MNSLRDRLSQQWVRSSGLAPFDHMIRPLIDDIVPQLAGLCERKLGSIRKAAGPRLQACPRSFRSAAMLADLMHSIYSIGVLPGL